MTSLVCYERYFWAVVWNSRNHLDGERRWLLPEVATDGRSGPALFATREQARKWRDYHYGYIKRRPDLRAEPHGWRLPAIVRVRVNASGSA